MRKAWFTTPSYLWKEKAFCVLQSWHKPQQQKGTTIIHNLFVVITIVAILLGLESMQSITIKTSLIKLIENVNKLINSMQNIVLKITWHIFTALRWKQKHQICNAHGKSITMINPQVTILICTNHGQWFWAYLKRWKYTILIALGLELLPKIDSDSQNMALGNKKHPWNHWKLHRSIDLKDVSTKY